MPCELCGRECKGCREAIIDGAKMYVCPECIKYSEGVVQTEPVQPKAPSQPKRIMVPKTKKPERDIFKDKAMEKELVPDWNYRIEAARKKKGLTREELGFKIGERTVTIAKLEHGDLRPSDQMIAKLEKELGISLMEDVKAAMSPGTSIRTRDGFTLGDFIKTEK
jgi:putative transcription factor